MVFATKYLQKIKKINNRYKISIYAPKINIKLSKLHTSSPPVLSNGCSSKLTCSFVLSMADDLAVINLNDRKTLLINDCGNSWSKVIINYGSPQRGFCGFIGVSVGCLS